MHAFPKFKPAAALLPLALIACGGGGAGGPGPTPLVTPPPSATPTASPSPGPSPSPSASPSPSPLPTGTVTPTPVPSAAPSPTPPPSARVCRSSGGGAGLNSCFELERIGGLAETYGVLGSLALSATFDRALTVLMSGAPLPCPVGGFVEASSPRVDEVLLNYRACDFGLGAVTGTVLSADQRDDRARDRGDAPDGANLTVAVTLKGLGYALEGSVRSRFSLELGGQGSLRPEGAAAVPVVLSVQMLEISGTSGRYRGTLSVTHGTVGFASASLFSTTAQTEVELTTVDALFRRLGTPLTSTQRYSRSSSPGPGQVSTQSDLGSRADETFSGTLRNLLSGGEDEVAADWPGVRQTPRYEFEQ